MHQQMTLLTRLLAGLLILACARLEPLYAEISIYAGGIAGVEALTDAGNSTQYRKAGGGLYLHNDGWARLDQSQQKQVLSNFTGKPIAIELGFREGASAWAARLQSAYLDQGILPDFIAANAFDQNNRPVPREWRHYTEALRGTSLPATTLILPTFEYANFGMNRETLSRNTVTLREDFQEIIRAAGGLVLDVPPGYAFQRERAYRDWVLDAIRWSDSRGYTVVWICSPHNRHDSFRNDARRFLRYLERHDALPQIIVVENYTHEPSNVYPNIIGHEDQKDTILGVATFLLLEVVPGLPVMIQE